ncbi:MAG: hypothetical protein ACREBU_16460 [Nitrososphaera sp.]
MLEQKVLDLSEHRFQKAKSLLKTNIFDKRFSEITHTAFDSRQDFDYDDFVIPTETEALAQFQNAQQLIAEVELKRTKLINGDLNLPKTP